MNLCCLQVRSPPNTGTLMASLPPLRGSPQNGRGWSPSTRRPLRQHPHAGLSRPRLWSRGQVVRTRRTSQRASPWHYRLPAQSLPWTKNRRRTFLRWRKSSLFPVVRSKWMGTGSLWNHWRPRELMGRWCLERPPPLTGYSAQNSVSSRIRAVLFPCLFFFHLFIQRLILIFKADMISLKSSLIIFT